MFLLTSECLESRRIKCQRFKSHIWAAWFLQLCYGRYNSCTCLLSSSDVNETSLYGEDCVSSVQQEKRTVLPFLVNICVHMEKFHPEKWHSSRRMMVLKISWSWDDVSPRATCWPAGPLCASLLSWHMMIRIWCRFWTSLLLHHLHPLLR